MKRPDKTGHWAVRILCALAILFVGFAHQPVAIADTIPDELAFYTFPDGTQPVICISDDETTGHTDKHFHNHGCDACRIAASALLPTPADATGDPLQFASSTVLPIVVEAVPQRVIPRNTAPRAPPALRIVA
jgi:hypothetical protein